MRICLIVNPKAGASRGRPALPEALECLQTWAGSVEVRETSAEGAEQVARDIGPDEFEVVVACGGDGTVNEVVNGIGPHTPVGILPFGTVNVLARELGIPVNDVPAACNVLRHAPPRPIDLGLCNGRRFVLMAGVGFDAEAVRSVAPQMKDLMGGAAYVVSGLKSLLVNRPQLFRVQFDGRRRTYRAMMLLVANASLYAGDLKIAEKARIDDGLLDICIFRERSPWAFLGQLYHVVTGGQRRDPHFVTRKARTVLVTTRRPAPVQLDGDYFGETPVDIEVLPAAVRILRPPLAQEGEEASVQAGG